MEIKTLLLSTLALFSIASATQLLRADEPKKPLQPFMVTEETAPFAGEETVKVYASNPATATDNMPAGKIERLMITKSVPLHQIYMPDFRITPTPTRMRTNNSTKGMSLL